MAASLHLLSLSPEVQSAILDCLDWPALINLKATCRQCYHLPCREQIQAKLQDFEEDIWQLRPLMRAKFEPEMFDENYPLSAEVDDLREGEMQQVLMYQQAVEALRAKHGLLLAAFRDLGGYSAAVQFLPCYHCLTMKERIDLDKMQEKPDEHLSPVNKSRTCINCILSDPESQENGTEYLTCGSTYVILCRCCKPIRKISFWPLSCDDLKPPNYRMWASRLCPPCWRAKNKEWLDFKKALKQEIEKRQQYHRCMCRIDRVDTHEAGPRSPRNFVVLPMQRADGSMIYGETEVQQHGNCQGVTSPVGLPVTMFKDA